MNRKVNIFPNIEELNNFAAEKFIGIAHAAIENYGQFSVALSGGSTPKTLFQILSGDDFRNRIDWSKVFFFFGDERNVLPEDSESNFRMAHENLFEPLKINTENIFRWQTEFENPDFIAEEYQTSMRNFFNLIENDLPQIDLILLGMGADGHTASLFPFTEALRETAKIAVANPVEKLNTTRLTLTFPVINNARNVMFLIAGEEKAETLKNVLEGEFEPEKFPSQNVRPQDGNLFWLLNENVAKLLKNNGN